MDKGRSKYRLVVDELAHQIFHGDWVSGTRVHTRREICERFGLSLVTAFKVQRELRSRGLIAATPGRGFVVTCPRQSRSSGRRDLRRVRMIGSPQAIGNEGPVYGQRLMNGLREECQCLGLELRVEFVQVLDNPGRLINSQRRLAPDEGLVVFLHGMLLPEIVTLLMDPELRVVLINQTFPDRTSVLVDNAHGIGEILHHLRTLAKRRVLYAGQFGSTPAMTNESERYEAFQALAPAFGFATAAELSGDYRALAERVRAFEPDAVMFVQDDAALHFRQHYLDPGLAAPPLLTGFDDFAARETGLETLTTYRIDLEEMGRRAVRQLFKPMNHFQQPLYERVRGRLVVREPTGLSSASPIPPPTVIAKGKT